MNESFITTMKLTSDCNYYAAHCSPAPTLSPRRHGPHLGLLLRHHVQLLLAHPGLGLGGVGVELLGAVGLGQAVVAPVRLGDELRPQLPHLPQAALQGGLPRPVHLALGLAAPLDVVDARLVALDLLLQRLEGGGEADEGRRDSDKEPRPRTECRHRNILFRRPTFSFYPFFLLFIYWSDVNFLTYRILGFHEL